MSSKLCFTAWSSFARPQFLVSATAAVMLTACSADTERFASNPSDADPVYTASVPKNVNASNVGTTDMGVSSKPLTGAASQPPTYDYSRSYKAPQYRPPAAPAVAAAAPATGGTVTVGPGMTLYSVARANDLSVAELAAANGIQAPYSVHTGQVLKLPGGAGAPRVASQNAIPPDNTSFAEPSATPIAPKPGTPAAAAKPFKAGPSVAATSNSGMHTVATGETLFSLGRQYGMSPYAIADANGLPHNAQLVLGQKVRIPAGGEAAPAVAAAKTAAPKAATAASGDMPAATGEEGAGQKTAAASTPAPAPEPIPGTGAAATTPPPEAGGQPVAEGAPIAGAPGMRWPVRGKIISGFGPKANGLKNEGINIAVPEGTSIRAAADGVVAYSGNELKGYGNLVLIRHEEGYVTAYAHASELFVKRGDTVKRGDVIAKAGQTGAVSSPQLHFEVRKGAVALDPMKFLSQNTASTN
ncbi:MAG: peptidoglycan DD-metalloendopeptidase family protein [Aestuariivirga sp.]|uniref:peptidoglycan DD-metalloendopeptidase family protein n=1 Tax=Aestuariivirga sp. TaxID=2650926 RepID=UPI0025BB576E|nr:peptidoglycan DD-metalloendopeptidase family protein [Aestuariivirga sp.]MCA3560649.1 peptidoglycan DD-metalloendopeptidase family protein [Aestuariivirga sp.]